MYARPTSSTPKGGLTLTENKRYVTPLRNEVDVRSKQQNLVTDNSFEKEFSNKAVVFDTNRPIPSWSFIFVFNIL